MADHHRVQRGAIRVTVIVVATLVATLMIAWGQWTYNVIDDWLYGQQDASEVFEYQSVEFIGRERESLRMVSTTTWHTEADFVSWVDQLVCDGGIYSTHTSNSADVGPSDLASSEWSYPAPFPDDPEVECNMRSLIVVEDRGSTFRQVIESETFRPGAS